MNRTSRKEPLKIGENPNEWSFEKDEYDLDIMEVYKKLEKLLNSSAELKPNIDKEEYLKNFKSGIEFYCKARNIDFKLHFGMRSNVIIPSTEEYYVYSLGMALACWDIYKIRAFLNDQKKKYEGTENFDKIIEFGVYSVMTNNTPFRDAKERQGILMAWVEEQSKKADTSSSVKTTPGKKDNKQKPPKVKSFEELFTDKSQIKNIIKILKDYFILNKDGSWEGTTANKSEILALIDVLREKRYIKKYAQILTGKLFCKQFGLDLKGRSLSTKTQTYYDTIDEYRKIIPDLKV